MSNFIFAFHGGSMPDTPEEGERVMAQWTAWMGDLGKSIVDPGGPVGQSSTVSAAGVADDGGANPLSGYMVVSAASKASAIEMAGGCPIVEAGGSVEVVEVLDM